MYAQALVWVLLFVEEQVVLCVAGMLRKLVYCSPSNAMRFNLRLLLLAALSRDFASAKPEASNTFYFLGD
jgi:hypothetical protein